MMDEKFISLSKTKLILTFIGSSIFVLIGFDMILRKHSMFFQVMGIIAVLFFSLAGVLVIKRMFDKKSGLIFNSMGITNIHANNVVFIPWTDIAGFSIYEFRRQKMLVVLFKNPNKYIESGGFIKRMSNNLSYKMSGSPFAISSNILKINFNELVEISNEYFAKYGN